MSEFRTGTLIKEALKNLAAGRGQGAIAFVASLVLGAGVCFLTVTDVSAIQSQHDELAIRGAYVFSVTDINRERLSGPRCEQLRTIPGVTAAGGIVTTSTLSTDISPATTVQFSEGTPGLADVLWPSGFLESEPAFGSNIVGADLAERFGLRAGTEFSVIDSSGEIVQVPISAVALHTERLPAFDFGMLSIVTPMNNVTACLVEVKSTAVAAVGNILVGWFENPDARSSNFFPVDAVGDTPEEKLLTRLSQYGPLVAFALAALVVVIVTGARRSDFALYAILGLRPSGLLIMLVVEYVLLVLLPVFSGFFVAILVAAPSFREVTLILTMLDAARFAVLTVVIPAIAFFTLRLGAPLEYLRGR